MVMPSSKNVIKLYVSDEEMEQILESANRAGLSLSTFGKSVCIGQMIESSVDAKAILDLIKISADMGSREQPREFQRPYPNDILIPPQR
ncbi:MAG: hypothetical protein LBQ51_03765 [Desulfovibrio sp.]|jgi:hypothetical protein|nr:hypothetical protein [Desulfovibrio sp.]